MAFIPASKSKRFYLLMVVVILAVLAYQIAREDVLLHPDQRLQSVLDMAPLPAASDPLMQQATAELARAQKTLDAPVANAPVADVSTQIASPVSGRVAPDAWVLADSRQATPSMTLPESVSTYAPVSVDMENPTYPEPGQQLGLTLPGGERLQVNVESSSTNPNGDYSWRGHLDGHGDEYPVVMTYGGNSVFATITTPSGSYTLESVNGSGWVYKNPSEFELSQPGKNDYLEVPHLHDHE
ncbi:MAG: hypothetical protein U1B30_11085 [Pseudomonadota bacterium]|nr:hypothetical protein [Pseudomonadota bacterium]